MKILLSTIKTYWKFLIALTAICSSIVTAAVWVGKVDTHVNQGNEKIREFDQSQIGQTRIEGKVDAIDDKVDAMREDMNKRLDRIERKLDDGRR